MLLHSWNLWYHMAHPRLQSMSRYGPCFQQCHPCKVTYCNPSLFCHQDLLGTFISSRINYWNKPIVLFFNKFVNFYLIMMVVVVVRYHIISIINSKHWFKVTHYVSVTYNYLSLFKYSYIFGCLMTVFADRNM